MDDNRHSAAASANASFVREVIVRAAEIIAEDGRAGPDEYCDALLALQQARDEFRASKGDERGYTFPLLVQDLGRYIRGRYPEYAEHASPVTEWSMANGRRHVANALLDAANDIAESAERFAIEAEAFESMDDKERGEYLLMQKAAAFLQQNGVAIQVDWERGDADAPVDYWCTINGTRWAFELKRLSKSVAGSHRKGGDTGERKAISERVERSALPLPQEPEIPSELQKSINKAIADAGRTGKPDVLNGANYCLVLHIEQFMHAPNWERVTYPDLSAFDAVLILHQDYLTSAKAWEVPKQAGLHTVLPSQNVADLAGISKSRMSARPKIDVEAIRAAWAHIESLNLTDEDYAQAIAQARGLTDAANASGAGHQHGADANHQTG